MSARHVAVRRPPDPVHRLGRAGAVWDWPDWAYAGEDGTFGNRYDDALGTFRVLYASSTRFGAFVETLARFRPDPHVLAATVASDERDILFPTAPAGEVPAGWLALRAIGAARVDAPFVDVAHTATLAALRAPLTPALVRLRLDDLDAATVRLHAPRALTQAVATHCYALDEVAGEPLQGIAYRSRLGDDVDNWAIWEPAPGLDAGPEQAIDADDPDLRATLTLFALTLRA